MTSLGPGYDFKLHLVFGFSPRNKFLGVRKGIRPIKTLLSIPFWATKTGNRPTRSHERETCALYMTALRLEWKLTNYDYIMTLLV